MILKIQRSIFTEFNSVQYLIYNENRTVQHQTSDPEHIFDWLFTDDSMDKVYVDVCDAGIMNIIEEQDW